MLSQVQKHASLNEQRIHEEARRRNANRLKEIQRKQGARAVKMNRLGIGLKAMTKLSLANTSGRVAEDAQTVGFEEGQVDEDEDVPFFLRKSVNKTPFGNVHMALRIGPLIIENGVPGYELSPHASISLFPKDC
jgi:hypothetical protein